MRRTDAGAVLGVLTGLVLFSAAGSALLGALLVAGGAYALILPEFVEPHAPT